MTVFKARVIPEPRRFESPVEERTYRELQNRIRSAPRGSVQRRRAIEELRLLRKRILSREADP